MCTVFISLFYLAASWRNKVYILQKVSYCANILKGHQMSAV